MDDDGLPPDWSTSLAVLRLTGSTVEDRDDHLVIRTPGNPDFHWGNCLFVRDAEALNDAARWVEAFHTAFPDAAWVSIGLVALPSQLQPWSELGIDVELDDVLTTRVQPRQTPAPAGYTVRELVPADWIQLEVRELAENLATGEYDPAEHERFVQARSRTQISLVERGAAAFFGAFAGDLLAADLGIVLCGSKARYQFVGTSLEHRRRGLASHLLGVAADWAAQRGTEQWVIVTEATNPAGRVYRRAGFEPDVASAQAYRRPSR